MSHLRQLYNTGIQGYRETQFPSIQALKELQDSNSIYKAVKA